MKVAVGKEESRIKEEIGDKDCKVVSCLDLGVNFRQRVKNAAKRILGRAFTAQVENIQNNKKLSRDNFSKSFALYYKFIFFY